MLSDLGKFQILKLLGRGSMGEVHLAQDPALGREVAIKTLLPGSPFGPEALARFEREARTLASLNHPRIVTLFDFGVAEGQPYLVMEYVPGDDLAALLERGDADRAVLLEALAQVCDGLGYAHARGVVHRDVKPGNIRIALRDGQILAKLMDFGIAAADRSELTAQGVWVGTVGYMAPEYLDTGRATPGSDLFAIGVVMYEVLTGGRKPFAGTTPTEVLAAILGQEPAPLRPADLQGLPPAVPDVLRRALAKDPAQRFGSAADLAAAIRGALASASGAAGPAPEPSADPGQVRVGRGTGARFLSLRVALQQAEPEAVLQLLPGTFREPVRVARNITLRGGGGDHRPALGQGVVVEPGAVLTLLGVDVLQEDGVGLRILPGAQVRAEDCTFQGAAGGVELGAGTAGRFRSCRFQGTGSAGLLALERSHASLTDCDLRDNRDAGLHAVGGARAELDDCRVTGNPGLGISAVDGAVLAMGRCEVAGNRAPGVQLDRGASGRLVECRIQGGLSLGVACRGGATLALAGCTVQGNALGGIFVGAGTPAPQAGADNRIADPVLREE